MLYLSWCTTAWHENVSWKSAQLSEFSIEIHTNFPSASHKIVGDVSIRMKLVTCILVGTSNEWKWKLPHGKKALEFHFQNHSLEKIFQHQLTVLLLYSLSEAHNVIKHQHIKLSGNRAPYSFLVLISHIRGFLVLYIL